MRAYTNIIISLLVLLMTVSCQDSAVSVDFIPSIEGHYIDISQNSLSFPSSGGDVAAQITTNKSPWAFAEIPDWLSVNPNKGDNSANIIFSAEKNLSADVTRTSVFYLMSTDENWKYRHFMSAQQASATPYLDLSSYSLQFKGSAGTERVIASTNTRFQAICTESWVHAHVSENCDAVEITVDENLTGLSRTTSVQLSGTINKSITITQQVADLTGESDELHYTCDEGAKDVKFHSETSWTVATSAQWIDVAPDRGNAGENIIRISVTENTSQHERVDYVYLKIGDDTKLQIPIRQDGVYISADVSNLHFAAKNSIQTLTVHSNILWEIISCPDWITPSILSAKGDCAVDFTASENPGSNQRNGTIKISQPGFSYAIEILVNQDGMALSSDVETIKLDDKEQSATIKLNTVGQWTAVSSREWLTITPEAGEGTSQLTISVTENKEGTERSGVITLSVGNLEKNIKVTQSGKYFSYTASQLSVSSKGGIINVSLVTNEAWKMDVPEYTDWITIDKAEGKGTITVNVSVSDNPSINSRECSICLRPENLPAVEFPIIQSGRYLTVDHTQLNFFAKGGTSEAIIIDTDGEISIECSSEWITINKLSDRIFTVTAERSMLLDSREGIIQISLADLANDETYSIELKVTQKAVSEVFEGTDYEDDENWN